MILGLFLFLLVSVSNVAAEVPSIGDSTIFNCVEAINDNSCVGTIFWEERSRFVTFRRTRNIIRNRIQRLRTRADRACSRGRATRCQTFRDEIDVLRSLRVDARACNNFEDNSCLTPPSVEIAQACNVVANPQNENLTRTASALISDDSISNDLSELLVSRITNGLVCSAASSSPVVAVLIDGNAACTGTLLENNFVITAAHCLREPASRNTFRDTSCNRFTVRAENGQVIGASQCIGHPNYSDFILSNNDVAVLILENNFSNINLAKFYSNADFTVGEQAVLAGFGDNEDRDFTQLRATVNTIANVTNNEVSTFFTLGDNNNGSTCVGDSGSPLFILRDGEWQTIGTLSNGGPSLCLLDDSEGILNDTSVWSNLSNASNANFINNLLN